MKRLIVLVFLASMLFAIEQVPRAKDTDNDKTSKTKTEIVTSKKVKKTVVKKSRDEKKKDYFKDADSNSVNDQREDDLQKIKWLNSKFKNLFKKKTEKSEESQKQQTKPSRKKSK